MYNLQSIILNIIIFKFLYNNLVFELVSKKLSVKKEKGRKKVVLEPSFYLAGDNCIPFIWCAVPINIV